MNESRLNVLLVLPDQWRWDWLGCAGYDLAVSTPNVDALAARGTLFEQCRCNSPVCAPSRACLVQGLRYDRAGVRDNSVNTDADRPNMLKQLRDAGYHVMGSGKFDLFKPEHFRGLDGWTDQLGRIGITRGFDQSGKLDCANNGWPEPQDLYAKMLHEHGLMQTHHQDYKNRRAAGMHGTARGSAASPLPRELYTDDVTGQHAERLLREAPAGEPWFCWVNFPGPHDPFDPPAELLERYEGVDFPPPVAGDPELDHQASRRAYAACCTGIDEWVGRLIRVVEARGELDNTLIIFASDHGEMLGDHGRWTKSLPQEGSVHVPLIAAGPGVAEARRTNALVELIDLAATITDAAGAAPVDGWDARSLWPVLRGKAEAHRDVQHSGLRQWRMVCDGRYKLVRDPKNGDALYDLEADPGETNNLIDNPEHAAVIERLTPELPHDQIPVE